MGGVPVQDSYSLCCTLSDPNQMVLETRTGLLSTVSGRRTYRIGADGMPTPWEGGEVYQIDDGFVFTAKQDVAGGAIRAGEAVRYVGTDNDTFADLRKENGETVRVAVNRSGWPHTIDGIDIEELFDGLLFAG